MHGLVTVYEVRLSLTSSIDSLLGYKVVVQIPLKLVWEWESYTEGKVAVDIVV